MNVPAIANELSSYQLVGVGESSHGTHEFFDFRSKLFQELVRVHGFNTLLLEDSPGACTLINNYISTGEGNLNDLINGLYSIWRVEELKSLIVWLRKNHLRHRVSFVGFDINQTANNMARRDELMAKNIITHMNHKTDSKALIWAHNSHIQVTGSNLNKKPMGLFLRKFFGKDYVAIAQFFGKGNVSATRLDKHAPPSEDRTLSPIAVDSTPPALAEAILDSLDKQPYFLTKSKAAELELNKVKPVRSIGWGLVPGMVNEIVEKNNIVKAFDGLVYFPIATHSHPLP